MQYALRALTVFVVLSVPPACNAQAVKRTDLASILNFEGQQAAGTPRGWGGAPTDTLFADDKTVHSGNWSARLERNASSTNGFSTITIGIPIDFKGERVELRGFLKTEDVAEFAGLWMREDGEGGLLQMAGKRSHINVE